MHRVHRFGWAAAVAASFACGGGADAPDGADELAPSAAEAGAEAPPAVERLPGTPDGGLRDWVAEIRQGMEGVSALAAENADSAQKVVVGLYTGRQEWLERYWGTYGLFTQEVEPELGQAVMDAEAVFHELLILVSEGGATVAQVDAAVSALDSEMETVLARAEQVDVPLVPPAGGAEADTQPDAVP